MTNLEAWSGHKRSISHRSTGINVENLFKNTPHPLSPIGTITHNLRYLFVIGSLSVYINGYMANECS